MEEVVVVVLLLLIHLAHQLLQLDNQVVLEEVMVTLVHQVLPDQEIHHL